MGEWTQGSDDYVVKGVVLLVRMRCRIRTLAEMAA